MKIGICLHPNKAVGLPENAFDFIEVFVQNFLVPEKDDADFQPNLEAARSAIKPVTSANGFLPADLKCVGPDVDQARLMRYADTAFRRAGQVGIKIIVFGSGGARKVPEGYPMEQAMDDFSSLLSRLGPIAQRHGVTLVVEPLNKAECNFITSLAEGAEAVQRANHPNVQLLADYYHMLRENEPASEVVRFGKVIKHAHVAELAGRGFPGKSREDFRPFFQALAQADYKGQVAIECTWSDISLELESSAGYLREQMAG